MEEAIEDFTRIETPPLPSSRLLGTEHLTPRRSQVSFNKTTSMSFVSHILFKSDWLEWMDLMFQLRTVTFGSIFAICASQGLYERFNFWY